jgi:hypothetical protein
MEVDMKKFLKAYFETYCGNYDVCDDWMRYLVCVYISNRGKIESFDEQRSKEKFNKLLSDPDGSKKLFATYKNLMSENNDVYAQFLNEREKYLNKQGSEYRAIYVH